MSNNSNDHRAPQPESLQGSTTTYRSADTPPLSAEAQATIKAQRDETYHALFGEYPEGSVVTTEHDQSEDPEPKSTADGGSLDPTEIAYFNRIKVPPAPLGPKASKTARDAREKRYQDWFSKKLALDDSCEAPFKTDTSNTGQGSAVRPDIGGVLTAERVIDTSTSQQQERGSGSTGTGKLSLRDLYLHGE